MADELTKARLMVKFSDGTVRRWRFELAPETPLNQTKLTAALVKQFLGPGAQANRFELTFDGTLSSPVLVLTEGEAAFAQNVEEEE
jgi:hypothetical protein